MTDERFASKVRSAGSPEGLRYVHSVDGSESQRGRARVIALVLVALVTFGVAQAFRPAPPLRVCADPNLSPATSRSAPVRRWRPVGRGPAGRARLPGDAEVKPPPGTAQPEAADPLPPHDPVPSKGALESEAAELASTWRDPQGFLGWFQHVDHKSIGLRLIVTAFGFFALGGILAALMRLQLAQPRLEILNPDLYNQFFTMHGTTMMFLFAVPIVLGFGVYSCR